MLCNGTNVPHRLWIKTASSRTGSPIPAGDQQSNNGEKQLASFPGRVESRASRTGTTARCRAAALRWTRIATAALIGKLFARNLSTRLIFIKLLHVLQPCDSVSAREAVGEGGPHGVGARADATRRGRGWRARWRRWRSMMLCSMHRVTAAALVRELDPTDTLASCSLGFPVSINHPRYSVATCEASCKRSPHGTRAGGDATGRRRWRWRRRESIVLGRVAATTLIGIFDASHLLAR